MVTLPTLDTIEELLVEDFDNLRNSAALRGGDGSLQPDSDSYEYGGPVRFTAEAFPDADFEYWSKAAFWGWDEAILLSFGKAPEIAHGDCSLRAYLEFATRREEYQRIRTLVLRAIDQNYLPEKIQPSQFVSWARRIDLPIPPALEAAVKKRSSPKSENKTAQAKENETLLKILIGLAIERYQYDPKLTRSSVARNIASDLHKSGISIDEDTVRKHLQGAGRLLPEEYQGL